MQTLLLAAAMIAHAALQGAAPVDTVFSGCAGGFSGGGSGVAVTSRGEILEWYRPTSSVPVAYRLVRTDSLEAAGVFIHLERIHFRSIHHDDADRGSDVSCDITLSNRRGAHTVAWGAPENVPPELRPLYEQIANLASDSATAAPRVGDPDDTLARASAVAGAKEQERKHRGLVKPTPVVGVWRQSAWKPCAPVATLPPSSIDPPIDSLVFSPDGTFSVTWISHGLERAPHDPGAEMLAEPYHGYHGRYQVDLRNHELTMQIADGNFVPADFVGKGTFRIDHGELVLTGVRLGTREATHRPEICALTFARK